MIVNRRSLLRSAGYLGAASVGLPVSAGAAAAHDAPIDPKGVLVDLTLCIGCRLCEFACKKANGIDPGPLASYDDASVCDQPRRPAPDALTVVNATALP